MCYINDPNFALLTGQW